MGHDRRVALVGRRVLLTRLTILRARATRLDPCGITRGSDRFAHEREDGRDFPSQDHEGRDSHDRDQREQEGVLGQSLTSFETLHSNMIGEGGGEDYPWFRSDAQRVFVQPPPRRAPAASNAIADVTAWCIGTGGVCSATVADPTSTC